MLWRGRAQTKQGGWAKWEFKKGRSPVSIGNRRGEEGCRNNIELSDDSVSHEHAECTFERGQLPVLKNKSKNNAAYLTAGAVLKASLYQAMVLFAADRDTGRPCFVGSLI